MCEATTLGATVVTELATFLRRDEEPGSDGSDVLAELGAGEHCYVLAIGSTAGHLMVQHVQTGQEGWVAPEGISMIPAKVWNFLLPASGTHQLRVEHIGSAHQRVIVDGRPQTARQSMIYEGPENSLLELRQAGGQWTLRVNGLIVEDYTAGKRQSQDESLRELRTKPEGSYLISTDFDASMLELNIVRKFRFAAQGHVHEVKVAHMDCIWQVICDGKLVERLAHRLRDNTGNAHFDVLTVQGQKLKASVDMQWQNKSMVWRYTLKVNGVEVEQCWTKARGEELAAGGIPVVCDEHATPAPWPEEDVAKPEADRADNSPRELPQGVSFDSATGSYQANIRAKTGKFIFLGEYRTPEEAHQRYLEALPTHCPDKVVSPAIPK